MAFIILYVTHKNKEEAKKIGDYLLNKHLIACANYFPIESGYWWNGNIESDDEFVSVLKTRKENWKIVKKEIEKIHPYDVPCIMKIEVEANEKYENWIFNETKQE
ncbi:MAG TPA: divalent-cation tolerance protein CutA [Bacteroidetes bacterium]|nr:divalent-cation tolerance protein CutA [Bacteroidota bacterium]